MSSRTRGPRGPRHTPGPRKVQIPEEPEIQGILHTPGPPTMASEVFAPLLGPPMSSTPPVASKIPDTSWYPKPHPSWGVIVALEASRVHLRGSHTVPGSAQAEEPPKEADPRVLAL
ncbi:hypothetical protein NDU88_013359 [Pleurodeles waltl]|uniref:Uncharacterized protein n=1 Tax=Pleurodeles waltl TaxID=8319 RepID=A0AAV7R4A6_PLEWA|nr:hypothetical protein NDU88_013359 [Pleurodeles waltl]